jgi:ABC-2 type transport system permease protein
MIAQIRSELLKIHSTRTTIGLILGMIALILLITLLTGLLTHPSGLDSKEHQRELLSLSSLTGVFSALAGVLLVSSEYRYGTIRPTILFNPVRSHVLTAKVIAGALAGLAFGVIGEAIGWAIGYAILDGRGITTVLSSSDVLLLALGGLAVVAVWGAIGAGLGAIIHNQVGAVITLLAWGVRRQQPPVRPRAFRRAVHADTRRRRDDGPQSPSPTIARRRRRHPDLLGRRTRRRRHRPNRPARHQLAPRPG